MEGRKSYERRLGPHVKNLLEFWIFEKTNFETLNSEFRLSILRIRKKHDFLSSQNLDFFSSQFSEFKMELREKKESEFRV